jgi:hypothetical protein
MTCPAAEFAVDREPTHMTDADKERDLELAHRAKARLDQTCQSPTREELAAIDRILIEQARLRLTAPASSSSASAVPKTSQEKIKTKI